MTTDRPDWLQYSLDKWDRGLWGRLKQGRPPKKSAWMDEVWHGCGFCEHYSHHPAPITFVCLECPLHTAGFCTMNFHTAHRHTLMGCLYDAWMDNDYQLFEFYRSRFRQVMTQLAEEDEASPIAPPKDPDPFERIHYVIDKLMEYNIRPDLVILGIEAHAKINTELHRLDDIREGTLDRGTITHRGLTLAVEVDPKAMPGHIYVGRKEDLRP